MDEKVIAFHCSVCNQIYEKAKKEHKCFEITGLDHVMEWSDYKSKEDLPDLDQEHWVRSDKLPLMREYRIVQVHSHFHMSLGESFWVLYTPALSSFNGWDSHPEEIDTSAFVKCCFEQVLIRNENKAWISIIIEDVVLLKDLCAKIPPRDGYGFTEQLILYGNPSVFEWQDWFLIDSSAQGNLGVWGLVRKTNGNYHLIAMGEWDFHIDMVYGGNLILPEQEWRDLLKKCT
ncbi:hypothetical protein M3231_05340 [Neobacillus mesonae]|nr:hypothetical protein [Neobacillus mesonae]